MPIGLEVAAGDRAERRDGPASVGFVGPTLRRGSIAEHCPPAAGTWMRKRPSRPEAPRVDRESRGAPRPPRVECGVFAIGQADAEGERRTRRRNPDPACAASGSCGPSALMRRAAPVRARPAPPSAGGGRDGGRGSPCCRGRSRARRRRAARPAQQRNRAERTRRQQAQHERERDERLPSRRTSSSRGSVAGPKRTSSRTAPQASRGRARRPRSKAARSRRGSSGRCRAARAERAADSDFALAGLGAHQEQVRDVRARHEQHEGDRAEQNPQGTRDVPMRSFSGSGVATSLGAHARRAGQPGTPWYSVARVSISRSCSAAAVATVAPAQPRDGGVRPQIRSPLGASTCSAIHTSTRGSGSKVAGMTPTTSVPTPSITDVRGSGGAAEAAHPEAVRQHGRPVTPGTPFSVREPATHAGDTRSTARATA